MTAKRIATGDWLDQVFTLRYPLRLRIWSQLLSAGSGFRLGSPWPAHQRGGCFVTWHTTDDLWLAAFLVHFTPSPANLTREPPQPLAAKFFWQIAVFEIPACFHARRFSEWVQRSRRPMAVGWRDGCESSRRDRQRHWVRRLVERSRCRGVVDTGHGVKATG